MTLPELKQQPSWNPRCLIATGAIRPGHWLLIDTVGDGLTLYVADEDGAMARSLWATALVMEIDNVTGRNRVVPLCH